MASSANVNIRLPQREADILAAYCAATQRSRTEVIREFIRSLEAKLAKVGAVAAKKRKKAA
jgi:ribbon-helix-helix CopG family protein